MSLVDHVRHNVACAVCVVGSVARPRSSITVHLGHALSRHKPYVVTGESHVSRVSVATEILYCDRLLKAFCRDKESWNTGFPLSRHRAYVTIVHDQGARRQSALGARPSYFLSFRDRKL